MPEELWTKVHVIVQEAVIKTIPKKKKCKTAKWLSEEALQIAVKRRKGKKYPFDGEGNGTTLQYSCLENPMDRGAWWAAVHGPADEPGGLRPMGEESDTTERLHFHPSLSRVGEGNGDPLVFLPGGSQGRGSLMGCRLWGRTESDITEVT